MGTLDLENVWTSALHEDEFVTKHKEFISGLHLYDEMLRTSLDEITSERLFNALIKLVNVYADNTFCNDVEQICNRYTKWATRYNQKHSPQEYYRKLSGAYRIAVLSFMPVVKGHLKTHKTEVYRLVTQ